MKAASAITLLLAAAAEAHYKFARVVVDGKPESADWLTVRRTNGTYRSDPVDFPTNDYTLPAIRCYQAEKNGPNAFSTIKAGSNFGFTSEPAIFHDGPVSFYFAKVPAGQSVTTWDGAGKVWWKAVYSGHSFNAYGVVWPFYKKSQVNFTIPKNTPSGDYLIRVEQLGMQQGAGYPKAQPYLSCAQVRITDGGNGNPGPLVEFPGAYGNDDPGLYVPVYPIPTSYTPPGPPVWDGK